MTKSKRRPLTTDDLLRLQEETPRKRQRRSHDYDDSETQPRFPDTDLEEVDSSDNSSNDNEMTPVQDGSDSEKISSSRFAFTSRRSEIDGKPSGNSTDASTPFSARTTFDSLGVMPTLVSTLTKMSIQVPTEVQAACIPPSLDGRDCVGNAKTGSGKTIAFAIPILQKLSADPYGIFALVLTPTRELAFQISEQFAVLGAPLSIRTAVVVGGMDMIAQALELEQRPHVVVATPGRIVDHLKSSRGEWNLSRIKFLVLDEADRLLTPTFAPELSYLFDILPKDRQTCLFTATLTPSIESIVSAPPRPGKRKPFVHRMMASVETVDTLKQHYILTPSHVREAYLFYLLCNPPESILHLRRAPPEPQHPKQPKTKTKSKRQKKPDGDDEEQAQPPPTIIFCTRPRTAAFITLLLKTLNIRSTALHSRLTQRERLGSLSLFRASVVPVLVSTDVGARGLDIEDVAMVVNWDLPNEPEEYTHRVGRTARQGRGGVAVSFVTETDEERVLRIEKRINTKLTEMTLPEGKVLEKLNAVSTAKRVANLELHDSDFGKREEVHKAKNAKRKADVAAADNNNIMGV